MAGALDFLCEEVQNTLLLIITRIEAQQDQMFWGQFQRTAMAGKRIPENDYRLDPGIFHIGLWIT